MFFYLNPVHQDTYLHRSIIDRNRYQFAIKKVANHFEVVVPEELGEVYVRFVRMHIEKMVQQMYYDLK